MPRLGNNWITCSLYLRTSFMLASRSQRHFGRVRILLSKCYDLAFLSKTLGFEIHWCTLKDSGSVLWWAFDSNACILEVPIQCCMRIELLKPGHPTSIQVFTALFIRIHLKLMMPVYLSLNRRVCSNLGAWARCCFSLMLLPSGDDSSPVISVSDRRLLPTNVVVVNCLLLFLKSNLLPARIGLRPWSNLKDGWSWRYMVRCHATFLEYLHLFRAVDPGPLFGRWRLILIYGVWRRFCWWSCWVWTQHKLAIGNQRRFLLLVLIGIRSSHHIPSSTLSAIAEHLLLWRCEDSAIFHSAVGRFAFCSGRGLHICS